MRGSLRVEEAIGCHESEKVVRALLRLHDASLRHKSRPWLGSLIPGVRHAAATGLAWNVECHAPLGTMTGERLDSRGFGVTSTPFSSKTCREKNQKLGVAADAHVECTEPGKCHAAH